MRISKNYIKSNRKYIDDNELNRILNLHSKWLSTNGEQGECADLSNLDLTNVNLDGVDLRKAIMKKVDLRGASLKRANLSSADLSGGYLSHVNFISANLSKANLRLSTVKYSLFTNTNVSYADFTGAKGYAFEWYMEPKVVDKKKEYLFRKIPEKYAAIGLDTAVGLDIKPKTMINETLRRLFNAKQR